MYAHYLAQAGLGAEPEYMTGWYQENCFSDLAGNTDIWLESPNASDPVP